MNKSSGSGLLFEDDARSPLLKPRRFWHRMIFGLLIVLATPISFLARVCVSFKLILLYMLGQRNFRNVFHVRCVGEDGVVKWEQLAYNLIVNAGLNHILNVVWVSGSQVTTWYMGLIDNTGYTAIAAGDTMGSHAGWAESQAYAASTRPAWSPGSASSQSITNGSTTNFVMNASKTIKGIFVTSDNTKGGTTGTLCSAALFSGGNQTVSSGDTLQCTYTINTSSS